MTDFKLKEGLAEEWKKAAGANCLDPYSFGVVQATVNAFELLVEGKTPEEVENGAFGGHGYSGFMVGSAAGWIAKFHQRGEEFNQYWNNKFGVSEEKAKGGTVNPALITIETP